MNAEEFQEFFRRQEGTYSSNQRGYGGYGNGYSNGYAYGGAINKSKYYNTLGVSEGSSKEEIKRAYRTLARKHHPDRFAQESENVRNENEKKFKEINEAYENLK